MPGAPNLPPLLQRLLGRLDLLAVALLLFAACVPRARDLAAPLENAGADRAAAALQLPPTAPALALVARLTPNVTLLQVWALLAHLLAAASLTWLLRRTHGLAAGLFALVLWGTLPVALLHGSLWGGENPGLACGLLAGAGLVHWIQTGAVRGAWLALAAAGLGLAWGWTAAAFVLALAVAHLRSPRGRLAAGGALLLLAGTALLHLGRATPPDWLPSPGRAPLDAFGLAALLVACAGLGLRAARALSPRARARLDRFAVGPPPRVDLTWPLAAGGLLALALEPHPSLLLLVPALAAAGAAAFVQVSRPLLALRAGLGPIVALVALVAVPGLAGFQHLRLRLDELPDTNDAGQLRPSRGGAP